MSKSKSFNPALGFFSEKSEQRKQEVEAKIQNSNEPKSKGTKRLPRINMAFQEENLEYLQIISRVNNISITAYVNSLVKKDLAKNIEILEMARKILKK